jgi:23S rRNA pseudouridine1911/1915/1917 synthase
MEGSRVRENFDYSQKIDFVVDTEGLRLDVIVASFEEIPSRSFAEKLILEGRVLVNGRVVSKSYRPKPGEKIEVYLPKEKEAVLEPYDFPVKIVFEDEHIVVVEKPSGLVVHPAYGHYNDTLVNALVAMKIQLSPIGAPLRPGVVHRLDKDTSGLMILAKTADSHIELTRAIKERRVKRTYTALACGNIYRSRFSVEAPITRHRNEFVRMTICYERGKYAITHFEVLRQYQNFTLLKAVLGTGRTHQIRVHLASFGHPIARDPIYGGLKCARALPLNRLFLHACELEFSHPVNGKLLKFKSELPEDLKKALEFLEAGMST